jgi:uncharacterized protein (TIGR00730 family)
MWLRQEPDVERHIRFMEEEFRRGFSLIDRIDRPAVSLFGSARTPRDHPMYAFAMEVAAGFSREGFAVITGGGPGVMEAGNRGAKQAGGLSVGLGIKLPHEQKLNAWVDLSYDFKHFYARKVCFVKASEGFVAFPGGFGTNDELFEALTLIQTRKIKHFPVVLFGSAHWDPMLEWVKDTLLVEGQISPRDLELFEITDEPERAVRGVVDCYRGDCDHVHGVA